MSPKIHSSFWSDPDVEKQPPEIKLAFIWLITNSQTNLLGVCSTSPMRFAFETGLKPELLEHAIASLPRNLFMKRDSVVILSFIRHQFGRGESLRKNNIWRAIVSAYCAIKDPDIRNALLQEYPEFQDVEEGLHKGLARAMEGLNKPKEQRREEKNREEKGECEGVLDFLNEVAKREFRPTDNNLTLIRCRMKEVGDDIPGIKQMIARQTKLWSGTEYAEYLQPSTLFGKENFGKYYDKRNLPIPTSNGKGTIMELRAKIERHRANHEWIGYQHGYTVTQAERDDLKALRQQLKALEA